MSADVSELSEPQREIYDLLMAGGTPDTISRKLGKELGIVNAQITRMRTKGIKLPGINAPAAATATATAPAEAVPPTHINPAVDLQPEISSRPQATGRSSNDQIARELGGKAMTADELADLAKKVGGTAVKDVHPMVLMGCTIQFVRLCGGRLTAHQVIEDVYSALRGFVRNGEPDPGESGVTKPLPQSDQERIGLLEEQLAATREELQRFREARR